ncbi:F0F1-type ATP synthase epsilon subunit [Ancylobacter sp. 3268]|uniref:hypothetical protein n=1 Tax=Ancylobacter sp. 3268 TaxID=2817752 RepID=UPI0028559D78|nr:hypothetical protein [Ancylobacter sp. 3268]MDR6954111.1 F0F1-type ATP synthase epsilon subunit [Ancylobacter sp. 3268]
MPCQILRFHLNATGPSVPGVVKNVDLTDSHLELVITAKFIGDEDTEIVLSSAEGEIEILPPHGFLVHYPENQLEKLLHAYRSPFKLFRLDGDEREPIGAGVVRLLTNSDFEDAPPLEFEAPGVQGRKGDKGDTGDVTPEAQQALDDAIAARDAAQQEAAEARQAAEDAQAALADAQAEIERISPHRLDFSKPRNSLLMPLVFWS